MRFVTPTINSVRSQASQLSDRLPGRTPKVTRRDKVRKAGFGFLAFTAIAGAAFAATRKRYVTGTSEVIQTVQLDDGRLIVQTMDNVTFAVAAQDAADAKTVATTGAQIDYRVSRATIGGIPAGQVLNIRNIEQSS